MLERRPVPKRYADSGEFEPEIQKNNNPFFRDDNPPSLKPKIEACKARQTELISQRSTQGSSTNAYVQTTAAMTYRTKELEYLNAVQAALDMDLGDERGAQLKIAEKIQPRMLQLAKEQLRNFYDAALRKSEGNVKFKALLSLCGMVQEEFDLDELFSSKNEKDVFLSEASKELVSALHKSRLPDGSKDNETLYKNNIEIMQKTGMKLPDGFEASERLREDNLTPGLLNSARMLLHDDSFKTPFTADPVSVPPERKTPRSARNLLSRSAQNIPAASVSRAGNDVGRDSLAIEFESSTVAIAKKTPVTLPGLLKSLKSKITNLLTGQKQQPDASSDLEREFEQSAVSVSSLVPKPKGFLSRIKNKVTNTLFKKETAPKVEEMVEMVTIVRTDVAQEKTPPSRSDVLQEVPKKPVEMPYVMEEVPFTQPYNESFSEKFARAETIEAEMQEFITPTASPKASPAVTRKNPGIVREVAARDVVTTVTTMQTEEVTVGVAKPPQTPKPQTGATPVRKNQDKANGGVEKAHKVSLMQVIADENGLLAEEYDTDTGHIKNRHQVSTQPQTPTTFAEQVKTRSLAKEQMELMRSIEEDKAALGIQGVHAKTGLTSRKKAQILADTLNNPEVMATKDKWTRTLENIQENTTALRK